MTDVILDDYSPKGGWVLLGKAGRNRAKTVFGLFLPLDKTRARSSTQGHSSPSVVVMTSFATASTNFDKIKFPAILSTHPSQKVTKLFETKIHCKENYKTVFKTKLVSIWR